MTQLGRLTSILKGSIPSPNNMAGLSTSWKGGRGKKIVCSKFGYIFGMMYTLHFTDGVVLHLPWAVLRSTNVEN